MKRLEKGLFRLQERDFFSYSSLFKLYTPVIVEQLLVVLLGIVDTLMASYLSDEATAGVSYVISITNWVNTFFSGLAVGASVLTSQYLGGGRKAHAAASIRMSFVSISLISAVFCSVLMMDRAGCLQLLLGKIEPVTLGYSVDYFTFMIPTYFFQTIVYISTASMRSQGNTKTPMILSVVMMSVGLGFKFVFSYGLDMGAAGFSLATMLSTALTATAGLLLLEFGKNGLRVFTHRHGARFFNLPLAAHELGIGLPVALDSSLHNLGILLLSRLLVTYGVMHSAASGIATQVTPLINMANSCWGTVGLVAVSRAIGADDKEQAKRYCRVITMLSIMVQLLSSVLGILLSGKLVLLFGASGEVRELAAQLIVIFSVCAMPFHPLAFALPQMLRGAGDVKFTMWTSVAAMFLVRVGLGYVFGTLLGLGAVGLFWAMGANWVTRTGFFVHRYRSGKWLTKKVT